MYPDSVSAKLEVDKSSTMLYSLNLAELVLDKIQMIQLRIRERRVWRRVVKLRDGTEQVEGEVK